MARLVLGLDLGPNSIGWALVDDDPENPADSKLIDLGVRVFPEGVDNFDTSKEVSRNEDRRIARGMRRQIHRRARRRKLLRKALVDAGLWPDDAAAEAELYQRNPYELRARALSQRLEPFQIGRMLLHLNQRRGFLSNRKKDRGDKEVQGMLAEINENEREREEKGFATIGAWLADKEETRSHANRKQGDHTRNRHLARKQYEDEFDAIWAAQARHYPDLLTDELKYGSLGKQKYPTKPIPRWDERRKGLSVLGAFGIHGLIFFQRPMYWPKSVVGLCELEPKQKRCPRADRRAQRFRLLQEVNKLKYIDHDTHTEQKLNDQQRMLLLDKLSHTKEMTFDQIRKALGFLEGIKFNLERGERSKLKGVPIDAMFAAKEVCGKEWYDRPEEQKSEIVATLLDNERDDDRIIERAVADWDMTAERAEAILGVDLPAGYANLSLKAIEKLLPPMEQGLLYMDDDATNSALHAAGYLRRDQLRRRIFDKLPDPTRMRDCPIGDIPNPVVKRTLTEVRKVVNAIVREYGRPAAVHIEMTRSVQMGKEKRAAYNKLIRGREAERDDVAEKLRENGIRVTRDNILKYQLWEQQNQECIYSGKPISFDKLFGEGGGVEVDHILPYKRTLDDSQMNKIVCLRTANAGKGDRTPCEWLADAEPRQYEQVSQRAARLMHTGKMPYVKYRRFIQRELELDKFIARQLADTGYITKATLEYLRCLFQHDHDVLGLKGQLTAELRWQWGLEKILEELHDSPAWEEKANLRPGQKNRADHRHHAIDAVVIALTNRSRLHQLSDIVKRGGARVHGEVLEDPWPNFRGDVVQAIKEVNVSHRVERKVRGGLHKDNPFGQYTRQSGEATDHLWVKRKPLTELSASEVLAIRDDTLRDIVVRHLQQRNIRIKTTKPAKGRPRIEFEDLSSGKRPADKAVSAVLTEAKMPSGVPVKKARLIINNATIQKTRQRKADQCGDPTQVAYVEPDDLHHACLFEWDERGKTVRDAVYVARLEAARRQLNKEDVVRRTHPDRADARFVFSIYTGDTVLAEVDGREKLMTVSTMVSTQKRIHLVDANDARRSSEKVNVGLTPNTFLGKYRARKVLVDPLGRIRWAND